MPKPLAVAFIAREKFSVAVESARSVAAAADMSFRAYFSNTRYPDEVAGGVREAFDDVHELAYDHYLLPNAALNRIIDVVEEDLLLVVENDVLFEPGSIASMISRIEEFGCGVVSPLILQGRGRAIHYDPPISIIERTEGSNYRSIVERIPRNGYARVHGVRPVAHIEKHAFLMTTAAAQSMYPFEETLCTREQVEFSLRAFDAGISTVFDDQAIVRYMAPPPLQEMDLDLFDWRWDPERAEASNTWVEQRWNLIDFVRSTSFVARMASMGRRPAGSGRGARPAAEADVG